jgi:hypothetical protein
MHMKSILFFLLLGLVACQPRISPTPTLEPGDEGEVTRGSEMGTPAITIIIHRSGGFLGLEEEWQINSDGSILKNGIGTDNVTPERIRQLREDLHATGIFEMEIGSGRPAPCPDCFITQITILLPGKEVMFYEMDDCTEDVACRASNLIGQFLQEIQK